jgi:hypothetical protein
MQRKKWFRSGISVLAILSLLLLTGCISSERVTPASPIAGDEITISTGTQGHVGQLFIGLGDTGKQDYVDANGKTRTHLAAGLFLHIDGNPPVEKHVSVHAGDTVEFQDYSLYVEEISAGGTAWAPGASTGHVSLIVKQPSQAPAPSVQP